MAVLPIRITGDPVLHSPALPVETIDDDLRTLVHDLFETMDAAPGVGLAAPQVGVPLRLFTYGWVDEAGTRWRGVAINPGRRCKCITAILQSIGESIDPNINAK